jgi:hypothetical protein
MGIGGHRDHLLIRDILIGNYERLASQCLIAFYEDLHYASVASTRTSGLVEFQEVSSALGISNRYRFEVTVAKLDLISQYRSQFEIAPSNLARFTPADGSHIPHEAIWIGKQPAGNLLSSMT